MTNSEQNEAGNPGFRGVAQLPFTIEIDALPSYFTAAANKRLLRTVVLRNDSWTPSTDRLVLSARVDLGSGLEVCRPAAVEIAPPDINDVMPLSSLDLKPSFGALAQLDEAEIGNLIVELHDGEQLLGEALSTVDFLAYNQWMMTQNFDESFAAFVLPSHPTISSLMTKARELLLARTGSSSTEGYQSGPERVKEILRAIYDTLQAERLSYSDPPASFEGYGQKIRTPDVIIQERSMTCLDSTVLMASCIAAAGLNPLLVRAHGHAFVACWMLEDIDRARTLGTLPAVIDNKNIAQDLASNDGFVPIETTMLGLEPFQSFEASVSSASRYFTSRIDEFVSLVDVGTAIQTGVRRIPTRIVDNGHVVIVVENESPKVDPIDTATASGSTPPIDKSAGNGRRLDVHQAPRRVRRWLDSLLDVSRSNSLINLKASPLTLDSKARGGVVFHAPNGLLGKIENALADGEKISVQVTTRMTGALLDDPSPERIREHFERTGALPATDPSLAAAAARHEAARLQQEHGLGPASASLNATASLDDVLTKVTDKRFKALKRAADDLEQQSASNQLYLCIGTLVWNEPDRPGRKSTGGSPLRSPLYIVPVRMEGTAKTAITITLDEGGELTPNYCLMEKLRSEMNLSINELEQPMLDDSGIDVDQVISSIRTQLGSGLHNDIHIEESAALAVLDFATFRTWRDLRDNWEELIKNPVVDHLVHRAHETFEDTPEPIEGDLLCPIACDESQLEAVRWAAEGRSFVLEGPPGTGKSQTIANLIAANMALGKRVLFVAEKQVALEVVSRRLAAIGLDPFCIVIHHESVTPNGIREQLRRSLDFEGTELKDRWTSQTAVTRAINERLARYRDDLADKNAADHTLWSAYQETLRLGPPTRMNIPRESLTAVIEHDLAIQDGLLTAQTEIGAPKVAPRAPWGLSNRLEFETSDLTAIASAVGELRKAVDDLGTPTAVGAAALRSTTSAPALTALRRAALAYDQGAGADLARLKLANAPGWRADVDVIVEWVRRSLAEHAELLGYFDRSAFNMDLGPQIAAATEAISAGFFSKKKKRAALAQLMAPITKRTETEPTVVLTLLQRLPGVRDEAATIVSAAQDVPGIPIPAGWSPLDDGAAERLEDAARQLGEHAAAVLDPAASELLQHVESGADWDRSAFDNAIAIAEAFVQLVDLLEADASSIERWLDGSELLDRLSEVLGDWSADIPNLLALKRWGRLVGKVTPLGRAGLDDVAAALLAGEESFDGLHTEYLRAKAATSLDERMHATGLISFERHGHDSSVGELVRSDTELKKLMVEAIPRQLVDRRPFRPKVRLGDVGKLEAELTRKVRRVSLPKLIRDYGEVVTHLTPCFLMSPDAVARLLPANAELFDIVVFDEASQIRVASAIPSMGRAKSVIVVGDSQQMPPSQRIGSRGVDVGDDEVGDDGDIVYADLESILSECRESNLPSLMLKCHFRSRHEGLITFSNRHFYESSLVTFPAPNTDRTTPITFHQVDGHFVRAGSHGVDGEDRNTNAVEANAIVAEIVRRLHDPNSSKQSMGVVTLNEAQRSKILSLLQGLGDPVVDAGLNHPDPERRLVVRALEQVQGDERDVILMSIGFSYQGLTSGKRRVPLNFGPLNNAGGERRLNVAVTRAKEEIVVFCSFDPDDMDLRNSNSVGLAMMKEFLRMARNASRGDRGELSSRDHLERDHYRALLASQLREAGLDVREEVGLSKFRIDLAVTDESGEQFLAILLDGPSWSQRTTSYDRDVLPDVVLRSVGWRRIGRVWLPGFIQEPGHVVATVIAEVARDRQRRRLQSILEARGYEVRVDTGLSVIGLDMAMRRPGDANWRLGIVLNGPDLFRQHLGHVGELPDSQHLATHGVNAAHRVWLPDFESDSELAVRQLEDRFDTIEALPVTVPHSEIDIDDPVDDETESKKVHDHIIEMSELATPYTPAPAGKIMGQQSDLVASNPVVGRVVEEILNAESPIEDRRLASLVGARFGFGTIRGSRFDEIDKVMRKFHITDHGHGRYVWTSASQAESWRGYRYSTDGDKRNVSIIPIEEIANAMADVVKIAHGGYVEEIYRHTASIFGRSSITNALRGQFAAAFGWGVAHKRFKVDPNSGDDKMLIPIGE